MELISTYVNEYVCNKPKTILLDQRAPLYAIDLTSLSHSWTILLDGFPGLNNCRWERMCLWSYMFQ